MYAPYFGLSKEPFSIAPDPRFLFLSEKHREALAHLLYGVGAEGQGAAGGFVLLTGEIGAGKTTVCRAFLEQVPARCRVAYVFNPRLSALELLQTVCDEFGIAVAARGGGPPTLKDHVDALNAFLLEGHARGGQALLIIDEAQALAPEVLEQLRLLTNLETAERKLLQIVLIGQPELRDLLARPELEQLAQRVVARWHLGALAASETGPYVRHRLAVAGAPAQLPFDAAALRAVHRLSGGVPRRINLLCDRALLAAYAQGRARVDARGVRRAAAEVFGPPPGAPLPRWAFGLGGLLLAGGAAALAWHWAGEGRPGGRDAAGASGAANAESAALAASASASASAAAMPAASASATAGSGGTPAVAVADLATVTAAAWPDEQAAWRALAADWRLSLPPGEACGAAAAVGAACYRSTGGLAAARQLDRPGLLRWQPADAPRPGWLLLQALDGTQATLRTRDGALRLDLTQLASGWRGDFATLWRPPAGWPAGGEAWVAERLAVLAGGGAAAAVAASAGGPALAEPVRRFQLAQGLPPDGRAGPMTLMRLAHATGSDEPRLSIGPAPAASPPPAAASR